MLNARLAAANEVAALLKSSELAIDEAVTQVSMLTACMPRVRVEANFAAEVGHEAIERAAASFAKLIDARREIIAAHQELSAVQGRIGLAAFAIGGLGSKDPANTTGLALVEEAA